MNFISSIFIIGLFYIFSSYAHLHNKLHTVVDLGWPYDNKSNYWVDSQPFVFTTQFTETDPQGNWFAVNEYCASEHVGTHFDAPYHFNKNGWKVAEVPLSRLIANGIMIDLTEETKILKDKTLLLPKHLVEWERKNGRIPQNCVILVKFGWSQYYSNRTQYLGIINNDEHKGYNFPGVSKEASQWIINSNKVVGVGVDTTSVDAGNVTEPFAHRLLTKNQIYLLENLNIPNILPEAGYTLYVMPMKIREGTGAPLRIIAQPNQHS